MVRFIELSKEEIFDFINLDKNQKRQKINYLSVLI